MVRSAGKRRACRGTGRALTGCSPSRTVGRAVQVDPVRGNVAFASPLHGWSFTLESLAALYTEV